MNEYEVVLVPNRLADPNPLIKKIKATSIILDDAGTLKFYHNDYVAEAYATGCWKAVKLLVR